MNQPTTSQFIKKLLNSIAFSIKHGQGAIWIKNTPITLKKTVFFYLCLLVLATWCWPTQPLAAAFLLGIGSWSLVVMCVLAYRNGVYVQLKIFSDDGGNYQLRDYYDCQQPGKSRREISLIYGVGTLSRIYLFDQKEWAFFDIIRKILEQKKTVKKILVLGGGGGAVPLNAAQQFPNAQITVVEISKPMIDVAQQFFLQKVKNIELLHQDAFKFVATCSEKFDLIFLDTFNGPFISQQASKLTFLKKIRQLGHTIFVNFGFQYQSIARNTRLYQKHMSGAKPFTIYLFGTNVVGCDINPRKLQQEFFRLDNL